MVNEFLKSFRNPVNELFLSACVLCLFCCIYISIWQLYCQSLILSFFNIQNIHIFTISFLTFTKSPKSFSHLPFRPLRGHFPYGMIGKSVDSRGHFATYQRFYACSYFMNVTRSATDIFSFWTTSSSGTPIGMMALKYWPDGAARSSSSFSVTSSYRVRPSIQTPA